MIQIECDNAKTPNLPYDLWNVREETMCIQRPHSMSTMYEAKLKNRRDGITFSHAASSTSCSSPTRTNSMPLFGMTPKRAVSRWEVGCYSPTLIKEKTLNAKWDSRVLEIPRRRLSAEKTTLLFPLAEQKFVESAPGHSSCPHLPTSSFFQDDSAFMFQLPDYQTALASVQQRFCSPPSSSSICHGGVPPGDGGASIRRRNSSRILQETIQQDLLTLPMRRASIEDNDLSEY